MVAFGGVVVDDVEDDFDTGTVQRADHLPELADPRRRITVARVLGMRGEESDGVVAPEVPQPPLDQKALVHEMVNRHQFDRRDAEALQILDRRRVGQPRIRAAHLRGQVVPPRGEALDVQLVDNALVQWMPRR